MARRVVQRYKSGKHLLKKLTDNPALPAFVKRLEPATLKKLIDEIGVEDSAALIELSSTPQMVAVLDESIWGNELPGAPETFQQDEFLRWLEAMLEVGEEFCADRLAALGDDVLVTAFAHFLDFEDLDKRILAAHEKVEPPSSADAGELYGPCAVRPKVEYHWDTLHAMLETVETNEPDLLQSLLYRCQMTSGRTAEMDAAYEHAAAREQRGFVTPESARVFLAAVRNAQLDELVAETEYDLETARYFRLVERAREAVANQSPNEDPDEDVADDETEAQVETGVTEQEMATDEHMAELEETVREVELMDANDESALLLTGPDASADTSALQTALAGLGSTDRDALVQRMAEVGYLSNVLMSGSTLGGERLSESEAAAAVSATCNLGFDYIAGCDISAEPGLIRLFRIGWNLAQGLPLDIARRLVTRIQSVDATASMRGWMLAEICEVVSRDAFLTNVTGRKFDDVHETLEMLPLVIAQARATELVSLINDMPRLLVDAPTETEADEVTQAKRFVASLDDLDRVDALLAGVGQDLHAL